MDEDRDQNLPQKKKKLYRMIYEELKNKILTRVYANEEMIPFERELCEEYGVDRITVRKALDLLVADGLLEKRAGLGSFVKTPVSDVIYNQSTSRNILFVMLKNLNDLNNNPSAFNAELFYSIEQECRSRSYSLFYSVLDEQNNLGSLINGNHFAGIIFVSYVPKHILDQCVQMRLPAICLNNRHENLISIVPEDEKGAYEAVNYLQSQGHRKIGILLGRREYYSTVERFRGYNAAMHDMSLQIAPRWILEGNWTFDGARNAIFGMLDALTPEELPTAIFCCSDIMAIGAMDALKERDLSIPGDVSVVGFDNVQQSSYVYPRLTTVSIDVRLMAELAVEKISLYKAGAEPRGYLILIPAAIEKRQSVREIAKEEL